MKEITTKETLKDMAMKVIKTSDGDCLCRECNTSVEVYDKDGEIYPIHFCINCGREQDWSGDQKVEE
jgi:Zn finger protein HypA/HybF involved in hydrogenase expression